MAIRTVHHVIILGCGRSGTSIFGELFEHLAPYRYFSEPDFDDLLHLDFSRPIAVKVPRESKQHPPTAGLSVPLEILLETIPDPKTLYWLVRNPLDTVCSLRVGIAQEWGHHPRPPDWRSWLERPLIERCAHHWDYINGLGYQAVRRLAQVKKFEDMIRNPRQFADESCREIGLECAQHDAELAEWAARVQNTNNKDFIEAKTSRPYSRDDHRTRIDRWKENLTAGEVKNIISLTDETAAQFGYSFG